MVNTGASDRFNLLIVALSKTPQLVVHHDTQIAAAVARVFHAYVGVVQVPFGHISQSAHLSLYSYSVNLPHVIKIQRTSWDSTVKPNKSLRQRKTGLSDIGLVNA